MPPETLFFSFTIQADCVALNKTDHYLRHINKDNITKKKFFYVLYKYIEELIRSDSGCNSGTFFCIKSVIDDGSV